MDYAIINGELYHYGLKGMKWGQRRWQYDDGRFNDAGKERYFGQKSSHRPDSVRVLQGDSPKQKSSGSSKPGTGTVRTEPKEFDKEKAKKIAKNVAIGAAVVGGTVLVAYGGYKLHEAGGFSGVSKNITAKMHETKLENLKTKQEYKESMAAIKSEGKARLAEIRENTKTEFAGIREEGKAKRAELKENLRDKAKQITGNDEERKPGATSLNQEKYLNEYIKYQKYYGGKEVVSNGRKYYTLPSDNENEPPILIDMGKVSGSASNSSSGKAKSPAQIVSEYKKEHPNTTLNPTAIVKNYKGEKSTGGEKKVPKLTLTPEHLSEGAKLVAEITKNVQTMNAINQQNAAAAKRGQKAVDDYNNELTGKKKKKG